MIGRILAIRQGCFINVGENLGQTLGSVLSIDPARNFLGFAPQVSACFFVERFLQDNELRQARVLPIGLSDANGTRRFWVIGLADVSASLIEGSGQDMRGVVISVRRGDDVLAELGIDKIAAIKINVEGAESEVISGLRGTLAKHRPPVLFEVLPNFDGWDRRPAAEDIALRQSSAADPLAALLHGMRLCCTSSVRDSSRESSVVAGRHEQTYPPRLQDQELARLQ